MTIAKQIITGADKLIAHSAQTSKDDPHLAIAQLLFSAAALAKTIDMSPTEFEDVCNIALCDAYGN